MIYTVTFNPCLDYVMHTGELDFGHTNRSESEEFSVGGKGINVSVILSNLGLDTKALGFTAGFVGEYIKRQVEEYGIKADFIDLPEGVSRINVKIKSSQETEINGQGPHIPPECIEELFKKIDLLVKGDTLVLAGSIPQSLPDNIYERIMQRLDGRGINIIVDATGDLLVNVLKYHPFLIKPNNDELGEIFGLSELTDEQIVSCAEKLRGMGARNVLVSMGKHGAILVDENSLVTKIGCPQGKPVNTVGSGDSMVAGFIAGYILKKDYKFALQLGTAAGSATALSIGLGSKDEIERQLDIVKSM